MPMLRGGRCALRERRCAVTSEIGSVMRIRDGHGVYLVLGRGGG